MTERDARVVYQAMVGYFCTECNAEDMHWMFDDRGLLYCSACTAKWWPHLAEVFSRYGQNAPLNLNYRIVREGARYIFVWYRKRKPTE